MRLLRTRAIRIVLDSALFVGFIVEFITREPEFDPDFILHSWVGIVLIPVIAVHLAGNWSWVQRVIRNGTDDREFGLGALNALLGTLSAICIVSGFPLWFEWADAGWLSGLHTITGMLAIVLMFVHLWMNRSRLGRLLRPRAASAG